MGDLKLNGGDRTSRWAAALCRGQSRRGAGVGPCIRVVSDIRWIRSGDGRAECRHLHGCSTNRYGRMYGRSTNMYGRSTNMYGRSTNMYGRSTNRSRANIGRHSASKCG